MILRFALFSILLLTVGCSPFQKASSLAGEEGLHQVKGVPFRAQQGRDDCGPAALASLLAFRGKDIPVPDIARAVTSRLLGGTLIPDMENFARRQGFIVHSGRGNVDFLRRKISAGIPVIVLVEMGFWVVSRPHYLVVVGFDDRRFLVYDGVNPGVLINANDLLARWEKMNRLYLYLE